MNKNQRIAIIGAGSAGLSAAYYLKEKGYTNITVFEKNDRVGGKCRSFSYQGKTFEMGAFTFVPGYIEFGKFLRKYRFTLCSSPERAVMEPKTKKLVPLSEKIRSMTSGAQVLLAVPRYLRELYKHRNLGKPGFTNVSKELCQPFSKWAKEKKVEALLPLFLTPTTLFGYGHHDVMPVAYIFKIYRFLPFLALLAFFFSNKAITSRVVEGFGRIWERLSYNMDVRLNSSIERIERDEEVRIHLRDGETLQFDSLIIACPFKEALKFLDLTHEQRILFSKVETYNYFVTVFKADGLPTKCLYGIPVPEKGHAYLIYRQWKEKDLYMAYSWTDKPISGEEVIEIMKKDVESLGGKVLNIIDQIHWNVAPHVAPEDMADGFYDKVEALQGKRHTYFTGSTVSYEFLEGVVNYSKALVEKNF